MTSLTSLLIVIPYRLCREPAVVFDKFINIELNLNSTMDFKRNCAADDDKKNRCRGENWSQEEKDLFLEIMEQSASIIENKQSDTNSNKKKKLEWIKVQSKFRELTGKQRDIAQLKGFWRRARLAAKNSLSKHKKALNATGNRDDKPPSPPSTDLKILALCPTDFVIDENKFDSDAIQQDIAQDNDPLNSTIYDLDLEIDNQLDTSFRDEIVTVADIHCEDVEIKSSHGEDAKNIIGKETIESFSPKKIVQKKTKESCKKKNTSKAMLLASSMEMKKLATRKIEDEYNLKIKYQKQELAHQQLRHKLEIEILLIEKEKKLLELDFLKKKGL